MTKEQFRQSDAKVKMPIDAPESFDEVEQQQPFTPPPEPAWLPMPDWVPDPEKRYEIARFPYDGAPIWARNGETGEAREAVWRVTRSYNSAEGCWRFSGFWAKRNAGGARLGFEPVAYKRLEA